MKKGFKSGLPIKKTCGNCSNVYGLRKEKGINVVYGFSNVSSIKWINCLIIFIYLY